MRGVRNHRFSFKSKIRHTFGQADVVHVQRPLRKRATSPQTLGVAMCTLIDLQTDEKHHAEEDYAAMPVNNKLNTQISQDFFSIGHFGSNSNHKEHAKHTQHQTNQDKQSNRYSPRDPAVLLRPLLTKPKKLKD